MQFALDLAFKEKVGITPGSAFGPGGEGYVRLSYASSDENLHEAMKRMKKVFTRGRIMVKEYNVAILGATGAVGRRMIDQLAKSTIPVKSVKLLASSRSAGTVLKFRNQDLTVEETTPDSFDGIDLVLSSAGGSVSKKFFTRSC